MASVQVLNICNLYKLRDIEAGLLLSEGVLFQTMKGRMITKPC